MGNRDPLIFLRQDCDLHGVRSKLDAISNSDAPNFGGENPNGSFGPDEDVTDVERNEPHGVLAQISEYLFFRKNLAVRAHKKVVVCVQSLDRRRLTRL